MAQRPKPAVRDKVVTAAAEIFATVGVANARMADIAATSGVPIGNLYRYFPSKAALFDAVLPPSFPAQLRRVLQRRMATLADPAEALDFGFAHRAQVLILLRGAAGTPYATFAAELADRMARWAATYGQRTYAGLRLDPLARAQLSQIYRGHVAALAAALALPGGDAPRRAAVALQTTYHLAGLRAWFAALARRQRGARR